MSTYPMLSAGISTLRPRSSVRVNRPPPLSALLSSFSTAAAESVLSTTISRATCWMPTLISTTCSPDVFVWVGTNAATPPLMGAEVFAEGAARGPHLGHEQEAWRAEERAPIGHLMPHSVPRHGDRDVILA